MGAPVKDVQAANNASAEALLKALETLAAPERRRHATVLNYWLSIRGDRHFPPIHDLDPLEISDAGPNSALFELIGGGEDADIRHIGQSLKTGSEPGRISEVERPSLLSCIGDRLADVAKSKNALAYEDEFAVDGAAMRCWVSLLPFSSTGVWVDYVYAFVSLQAAEAPQPEVQAADEPEEAVVAAADEPEAAEVETVVEATEPEPETAHVETELAETVVESFEEPAAQAAGPGFSSKLFDTLAGVESFFGRIAKAEPKAAPAEVLRIADELVQEELDAAVEAPAEMHEPVVADEPAAIEESTIEEASVADEPVAEESVAEQSPAPVEEEPVEETVEPAEPKCLAEEGTLQSKLEDVRSKAEEARLAKLRSNIALYEGLGAAYDFALDAEHEPEQYLKLVEEQGLKIQLRSPMTPVVKLAFGGLCDESIIGELEAVLAWALKNDLPRGSLAGRLEEAGGITPLLNGQAKAA